MGLRVWPGPTDSLESRCGAFFWFVPDLWMGLRVWPGPTDSLESRCGAFFLIFNSSPQKKKNDTHVDKFFGRPSATEQLPTTRVSLNLYAASLTSSVWRELVVSSYAGLGVMPGLLQAWLSSFANRRVRARHVEERDAEQQLSVADVNAAADSFFKHTSERDATGAGLGWLTLRYDGIWHPKLCDRWLTPRQNSQVLHCTAKRYADRALLQHMP